MNLQEVKDRIIKCINKMYKNDSDLLTKNIYEVTISCKLVQYLFSEFFDYDVDCEYDKHKNNKEEIEIDNQIKERRPDILIHKRGNDNNNLAVIEMKKSTSTGDRQLDYKKLKSMTLQTGKYRYKLGLFVDLAVGKYDLIFFINGEKHSETQIISKI